MLKKPIKASQIANLTDARYFAAWEVKWLGFCLDTGADHFLRPAEVQAMKAWVEGPEIVGEFGHLPSKDIYEIAQLMTLDAIQVGPFGDPEELSRLGIKNIFQELVLEINTDWEALSQQMEKAAPFVRHFILNLSSNGLSVKKQEEVPDLVSDQLRQLTRQYDLLLDCDLKGMDVLETIEKTGAFGLSLKGGAEEKVGVKSFDDLDEILEALEIQV